MSVFINCSVFLSSAGTVYKPRDSWICGVREFAKPGTPEISEKGLWVHSHGGG